ncbi:MAG: NADH-quinone oxidoreductase subunit NuoG [Acidimicrobiales bacterium]
MGEGLTLIVDGREVPAAKGEKIIAAAERAGTYIPRFCYHPRMRPVGMCRMCLVEVKGPRGYSLQPACYLDVADNMEIVTNSSKVRKAQDGVLELLLINHPLDCPVCDKGGECPLQDQTLTFGPGESRFVESKRHWDKPIPISDLVYLDRERCIQCDRCTRFATEVAGEPLINFFGRGDHVEVNTFPGLPFNSYFSGNTVQICPVGALTASPYRFKARPWDLAQVESTCTSCSVGCRVAVQSSSNHVIRYLGVDSDPVNQSWLCDKGRFDFEAISSPDRITHPLAKRGDELVQVSWAEALAEVATGIGEVAKLHGPNAVAFIGGARLANEDAYAWAKLAKAVIGSDSTDARLGDGLQAEVTLGLPRATIDEACTAKAVLLLAPDLAEELPIVYLRLRQAVVDRHLPLVELTPAPTRLTSLAQVSVTYRPGEALDLARQLLGSNPARSAGPSAPSPASGSDSVAGSLARARDLLGLGAAGSGPRRSDPAGAAGGEARRGDGVVVILGRPSLAETASSVVAAAAALIEALPGAKVLSAQRRGNIHGALDMGLAPGMLPGRVTLDAGRQWYTRAWGRVPDHRGSGTAASLVRAAGGEPVALVLLGADPLADFPDRRMARHALDQAAFVVSVDCLPNESNQLADVVLPAAMYGERAGTTTNLEGRITRLGQKVVAPGTCLPDWMIASEVATALGAELGLDSLEGIWDEICALAPSHAGITRAALAAPGARDGIVAPLPATPVRIRPPKWADLDPMATPGIASAEMLADPDVEGAPSSWTAKGQGVAGSGDAGPGGGARSVGGHGGGATTGQGGGARSVGGHGGGATTGQINQPGLVRFAGPVGAPEVPRVDAYGLRLVVGRSLYDQGTLLQACGSLASLSAPPRLRVNPYDLDRLGKATGDQVRAHTARAATVVEVLADAGVPRGSAVLGFNLRGGGAGDLIDATTPVTDVRLEST